VIAAGLGPGDTVAAGIAAGLRLATRLQPALRAQRSNLQRAVRRLVTREIASLRSQ
jgi:hypothetical protein